MFVTGINRVNQISKPSKSQDGWGTVDPHDGIRYSGEDGWCPRAWNDLGESRKWNVERKKPDT